MSDTVVAATSIASLSSRRAWIEILDIVCDATICCSRSPHGERGLKSQLFLILQQVLLSLSSRRAWIEIMRCLISVFCNAGRSPHGERGLKYNLTS